MRNSNSTALTDAEDASSWPYDHGNERWIRGTRSRLRLIARVPFGFLCLPIDLLSWLFDIGDRRSGFGQRRVKGLPHEHRAIDLSHALRDVVTVFAGAILGLSLTKYLTESDAAGIYAIPVFAVVIGIFVYHLYDLKQRRLAQSGSWEPDVDPVRALETLHREWSSKKVPQVAWTNAALEGNRESFRYSRCWSSTQPHLTASALAVPALLFLWALASPAEPTYGLFVPALLGIATANYAAGCFALWITMKKSAWDTQIFHARHTTLTQQITAQQELEQKVHQERKQQALLEQQHRNETTRQLEHLTKLLEKSISGQKPIQNRTSFIQRLKQHFNSH